MRRKYFRPTSLAWWASATPLIAGAIKAASVARPELQTITAVIDAASGDMPAPVLINMGLIGIGLRGALQ